MSLHRTVALSCAWSSGAHAAFGFAGYTLNGDAGRALACAVVSALLLAVAIARVSRLRA